MNTKTITQQETLEVTNCESCGIAFAVPVHFMNARRADGQSLYCPSGHSLSYRETELDRVKAKLAEQTRQATAMAERAREMETQRNVIKCNLASTEAKLRKANKKLHRVGAGVCPCCRRTFQELARHMKSKHPEMLPPAAKAVQS